MEQREDEFEHDPDEEPQQYDADAPENAEDTQETEDLEENEDLQENEELRVQEEEEEEEEEEGEGEGGAEEEEEEEVENEQEPEQQQEHEHEDEPDNDCGSPYSAVEETPFAEPQPSISASQSLPSTPSESSRRQDVSEHERERERDYRGSMRGQKRDYEGHAVSSRESGNYVKLFIGYVPKTATEDEIRPVFEKYGKVLEVGLVRDKMTGQQRGCCFIRYETKEEADRAISALHNQYTLPGSEMPVSVKFADGELDRLGAKEHKLYVSNLHEHTTEKELEEIFSAYGSIENITILKNSVYQRGGSAFVKYTTRNMALAAIDALHDNFVMEGSKNPLVVRFAENKRRRVESDAPYPSYPPYNRYSSGYGSYGRTSDRNNPVGHRPSVGRHYERHRRGSGFDVSPDMVDVMQNSRSEGNGAWRSGNAPHKTVYGSRGLPYGEQVQAYDNQQAPMKQLHHPSHQYQQHMNQSFPTSQMHYPQQSSQHGYLPQMQQRSEHSGDTLSKYRSYMPPVSAQSQWKPQVAAATGHQYLNQSPQAVPYAASYIQNQSMPTTPVAMNQGVLPQAVANTAFNPQPQQQLMMQQASNPAFQYPAGQNATNQLMPQHMLQQSLGHQAIQGIPIQGIPRQMQVPFQNTLNPMIQPPAYAHAPQTLQNPMAQVPNQAIQSGQVSAQQQYLFPQQMPAMQHASSQFMQTGQVPQNIQYPNQQANAAVVPGNAASNLAMPSLNPVPTDPARGTAIVASGVPVNAASDWTEHTAPDGSKYYYNKATRVSQWDKPPEMLAIEQKQEPATLQVAPQAQSQQHMPQMNPQYPSQSLQAQHMQSVQPNMPKPQSSFAPNPVSANMVPAVAVTNVPQATAVTVTTVSDTRASIQSSASDWSEHTSPDGHKYYYNKVTKASQWDKPAELIAAEKQQTQPLEAAQHISKAM